MFIFYMLEIYYIICFLIALFSTVSHCDYVCLQKIGAPDNSQVKI